MRFGTGALLRALLPLLAAAGITAGAAGTPTAVSSTLYAGFDADGNIRLTYADGTMIGTPSPPGTVVPTGTYTINLNNNGLDDVGGVHSFHLFGPGVNLSAGSNLYATTTWTATFQAASTYVYQDDDNPTTIREVFGTPGSGAGTGTSSTPTTITAPTSSGGGKTQKPTSQDIVGSAYPAAERHSRRHGRRLRHGQAHEGRQARHQPQGRPLHLHRSPTARRRPASTCRRSRTAP